MENQKSFLITLTAPTCAGKSYLLSYIRDVAKFPCFVSTTTRAKREGEVEGVDYYFISKEESEAIEARDGFAELAIFRGHRYGVTKEEFRSKLETGMAFLIVEPTGIDHYVKPALEVGAEHLAYFVDVPTEIRIERFKKRFFTDIDKALHDIMTFDYGDYDAKKIIRSYTDRLIHMLGPELEWKNLHRWAGTVDGRDPPEANLNIILDDLYKRRTGRGAHQADHRYFVDAKDYDQFKS